LKPPEQFAVQIHEPKMNIAPLLSVVLMKQKDAIEFSGGCSMNTPTWCAS
jgi:hypothetical protein